MVVITQKPGGIMKLLHQLLLLQLPLCLLVASQPWGQEQSHGQGEGLSDLHSITMGVDVGNAALWRCPHPGQSTLKHLRATSHELQLEVSAITDNWLEVISSDSGDDIVAAELTNCTKLAHIPDLLAQEMHENWNTLQYHTSPEFLKTQSERLQRNAEPSMNGQLAVGGGYGLKREAVAPGERCKEGQCADERDEDEWFTHYYNLSAIYQWYRDLAEQHPSTITLNSSIGRTHYDRDIMALHITDQSTNKPNGRLKIYLQCLLHAREWISGSVCMYLSRYLAAPNPGDQILAGLLKQLEFIIVPVANPDGYYLTWLQYPKYRLWRKNASPLEDTHCAGVDLNRNFDVHWNEADSSKDPCSELYGGPTAASEKEVQAISSYIESNSPVHGAIDFHSYYQEVLYPPASTKEDPKNIRTLQYVAQWVAAAASQVGEKYTCNKMNDIYLASGTFPDWMLGRLGEGEGGDCIIPLTVELRPAQRTVKPYTGFLLPRSEILLCCEEMVPAVVKFSQLVAEKCT